MTTETKSEEEILSERFPPLFKGVMGNKEMNGATTILDAVRLEGCSEIEHSYFEKRSMFPCGLKWGNEQLGRGDPRDGWGLKYRMAHQRHHTHMMEHGEYELRYHTSPDGNLIWALCDCDYERGLHRKVSYSDRPFLNDITTINANGQIQNGSGINTAAKPVPVDVGITEDIIDNTVKPVSNPIEDIKTEQLQQLTDLVTSLRSEIDSLKKKVVSRGRTKTRRSVPKKST